MILLTRLSICKASIVQNDLDEIEISVEQEEKVLHRIKICEDKRAEAVKKLCIIIKLKLMQLNALDKLANVLIGH